MQYVCSKTSPKYCALFTWLPWHLMVPWNSSQNYSVLSRHLTPQVEPAGCKQFDTRHTALMAFAGWKTNIGLWTANKSSPSHWLYNGNMHSMYMRYKYRMKPVRGTKSSKFTNNQHQWKQFLSVFASTFLEKRPLNRCLSPILMVIKEWFPRKLVKWNFYQPKASLRPNEECGSFRREKRRSQI